MRLKFKALSVTNIRREPGITVTNEPIGVIRQGETVLLDPTSQVSKSNWLWYRLVDGRGWCATRRLTGDNVLLDFIGVDNAPNGNNPPFNVTLEEQYRSGEWSWETAHIDEGVWLAKLHVLRDNGNFNITLIVNKNGNIQVEQEQ